MSGASAGSHLAAMLHVGAWSHPAADEQTARRGYEQGKFECRGAALWDRYACRAIDDNRKVILMTDEELETAVVEGLHDELKAKSDFVLFDTTVLVVIPFLYGILTFVYSNALWNPNGVHAAALKVPGAPETWGAAFLVLSLLVAVAHAREMRKLMMVSCGLASLLYFSFMWLVLLAHGAFPRTLGQAVLYLGFALMFLNRAHYARVG